MMAIDAPSEGGGGAQGSMRVSVLGGLRDSTTRSSALPKLAAVAAVRVAAMAVASVASAMRMVEPTRTLAALTCEVVAVSKQVSK